jgi:hypothetical protein
MKLQFYFYRIHCLSYQNNVAQRLHQPRQGFAPPIGGQANVDGSFGQGTGGIVRKALGKPVLG